MGFHLVFQNKQTCRWKYAIYNILYLCVNVFHIFSICDFFRFLHAKHSILSEWNENKYCKFTQYRAHTHQCTGDCNCCAYVCVCVRGDGLAYLWWSCGCGQLSIMRLPNQSEEARSPKHQSQIIGAENKTLFIKILQQNSKKKHLMFQLDCKTRNRQRTTTNCRFNSHSDPSLSIHRISPIRFSWPCLRWANTTYWFYCKLILCAPATPTIPHTYSRPVTDWLPAV